MGLVDRGVEGVLGVRGYQIGHFEGGYWRCIL